MKDVWLNTLERRPEWLVLGGGPKWRGRWIPVRGSTQTEETLVTRFAPDQIQAAPRPTVRGGEADPGDLASLRRHYGLKTSRQQAANKARTSGQSPPPPGPVAGKQPDDAMTRSEEEVQLRRSVRPREKVRLVKRVIVDKVELPVTLRREELVIERAPFPPGSAPETGMDAELRTGQEVIGEVVLYEEQPVVSKRVVPKERLRLVKTTVVDEQQLKEQVRKEQIRVEKKPQR